MNTLKIIILLALLFPIGLFAQQRQIQMTYDAAGNRISQQIIILPSKSKAITNENSDQNTTGYGNEWIGKCEIRIYPNPTKGALKVQILGIDFTSSIPLRLFNSEGALLIQQPVGDQETSIDFSFYPSGVYILSILIDGVKKEFKIIKE